MPTSDKLVFHRPVKRKKQTEAPVIRVSEDAYDLLVEWGRATGHSLTYIASEMIIFADAHSVLSDEEESR